MESGGATSRSIQEALDRAAQHHRAGRLGEAETLYRRVLAEDPNNPHALNLLGVLAGQAGRAEAGIQLIKKAIAIKPDFYDAQNNLGCALAAQGRPDEAVAAFTAAVELNPQKPSARANLGAALLQCGRIDESIALFDRTEPEALGGAATHSNFLMTLNYVSDDPVTILNEQRRWNQIHAEPLRPLMFKDWKSNSGAGRLRIGYVSGDFSEHPVGRNVLPLLRDHARDRFEIFCYSNCVVRTAMTERLRGYAIAWRDIYGAADEDAARIIHDDGIDILVDLSLHSAGNRLKVLALKPAPVQATFAGYPGGTGMTTIDYRLTDPYLDPPGTNDDHYVENSIRLSDTFWCYDAEGMELAGMPAVSTVPAAKTGAVTFGCFNAYWKVNDGVFALWAKVLEECPDARLIMLSPPGFAREKASRVFSSLGIQPHRVEFVDRQMRRDYFNLYGRIDIALDTFPYNGHTTSLDSYWMGVPVVTLVGRTSVGRAGFSQLSNLGLAEFAAQSPREFVAIAKKWAFDVPRLGEIRSGLRQRMLSSPLMDARRFAREVEAAYERMWLRWKGDGEAVN